MRNTLQHDLTQRSYGRTHLGRTGDKAVQLPDYSGGLARRPRLRAVKIVEITAPLLKSYTPLESRRAGADDEQHLFSRSLMAGQLSRGVRTGFSGEISGVAFRLFWPGSLHQASDRIVFSAEWYPSDFRGIVRENHTRSASDSQSERSA